MENAKTFRKERTYLIYGIILFFILINLFFLPKSTHNAELATSAHSTTPIIPIQPDKPTTNNNIPEGAETKPITTIPEEKKEDKPPVVEKPKEEAENKETKQKEKKSESNKDNAEKADNKSQEKTAEKPNEETKVVPPPTEVKEEPKPQNDNTNNNKPAETEKKEPEKVTPVPPKEEETKPEDNKETKGREQMNFQQTTSRRFLRGFENFCMFGFIGVIVYLIYNNGENNNEHQSQDNQRDNKKKDNTNPSGYALLDDDAEYYENI